LNIQLIALDLDGTLLRSDKLISERTVSALRRCKEKGIKIVLVTARSFLTSIYAKDAVSADLLVVNGGAEIRRGEETLFSLSLPKALAGEIISYAAALPSFYRVTAETDDGRFFVSGCTGRGGPWDYSNAEVRELKAPIDSDMYKLVVFLGDDSDRAALTERYSELAVFTYVGTEATFIAQSGAQKWNGLSIAADILGVSTENTVVFGDDAHDKEMIERCGVGVAMGNAIDSVKSAADFIAKTADDDGVAEWIETYLL